MLKNKTIASLIVLLALPSNVLAVSLSADDTVAGLGTDIDISDLAAGEEVTVVITPPVGVELVTDVRADTTGTAHVQVPGNETEVAGMHTVSLEQHGAPIGVATVYEVLADTAHAASSSISSDTTFLRPDGIDTAEVIVILRDRYGNPLAGRPTKLISSRASDMVSALQQQTDEYGEQRFAVRTQEPGALTLRAIDFISGDILSAELALDASAGSQLAMGGNTTRRFYGSADVRPSYGSPLRAQLTYGAFAGFEITAPRELSVNEDATIRITAVDENMNRVEDYVGTALISSTDQQAFLPLSGKVPFIPSNLGEKQLTLGLRFRTPGTHILRVEDAEDPSILNEIEIEVTGGSQGTTGTKLIQIIEPEDNVVINEPSITITGNTEPFVNLIISGGRRDVQSETDINGDFSEVVKLDPDIENQILRVRDESGILDSGDIEVTLDTTPPAIHSISLTPEEPEEESDVLFVMEIDPDVVELSVLLNDEPIVIEKAPGQEGKFQSLFQAPAAGKHEMSITIGDSAGNSITQVATFSSTLKGLPKVTGVTAETQRDTVVLAWDPIESEEIEAYRVYIGESPTEFAFSRDTDYAVTGVDVQGLQPGTDYYFTVTALKGERESEEHSNPVKATVFGIRLDVQQQSNALQLDWSNMQTNIPLSSFILEYGVEPGVFTEKRILNGDLRNYTIRDLINEVSYFVQLTPVSLTGELVEDMVATNDGKPLRTAGGFRPTPADPVPFDVISQQVAQVTPPPDLHSAAPSTPPTGLPSPMWWITALIAGGVFFAQWKRRRTLQQTVAFLQSMENRYHSQ